jgi:hypothetical protein
VDCQATAEGIYREFTWAPPNEFKPRLNLANWCSIPQDETHHDDECYLSAN